MYADIGDAIFSVLTFVGCLFVAVVDADIILFALLDRYERRKSQGIKRPLE